MSPGTVDILHSGLDQAFRFPDTNCIRKVDDVEVVIGLQINEDHIDGFFGLQDMDDKTRFKVYECESLFVH